MFVKDINIVEKNFETNSHAETKQINDIDLRNIIAQETIAHYTPYMFIVSLLSLFVTVYGTRLLNKQIGLTREAIKDTGRATDAMNEANRIAHKAQRAWLTFDIESPKIKLSETQYSISFELVVHNIGRTVARELKIEKIEDLSRYTAGNKLHETSHGYSKLPALMPGLNTTSHVGMSIDLTMEFFDILVFLSYKTEEGQTGLTSKRYSFTFDKSKVPEQHPIDMQILRSSYEQVD